MFLRNKKKLFLRNKKIRFAYRQYMLVCRQALQQFDQEEVFLKHYAMLVEQFYDREMSTKHVLRYPALHQWLKLRLDFDN
jgi:hypothetical protein